MGYTKLFSSIVASTIWRADDKTRIVWITMLAMKNERHIVEASLPGLADMARVTIAEAEAAIKKFMASDKWSRNKAHEGRRIEECDGGWRILNGEYYRQLMSADDRREYQRLYQRKYRAAKKTVHDAAHPVMNGEPLAGERLFCALPDERQAVEPGRSIPLPKCAQPS